MVTGAALLILANTEKGEKFFEDARSAVLKCLDKLEGVLSHKDSPEQEEWESADPEVGAEETVD